MNLKNVISALSVSPPGAAQKIDHLLKQLSKEDTFESLCLLSVAWNMQLDFQVWHNSLYNCF